MDFRKIFAIIQGKAINLDVDLIRAALGLSSPGPENEGNSSV
jgi:hypothetical protein